jgi:outer membrane protein assembly factor BamA
MSARWIKYVALLLLVTSCGVRRYLPEGEKLYRGATIHVKKNPETKEKTRQLRKLIKMAAKPVPNKFLLGKPYKVWWWYVIGEPKREKGFKAFLRKKLGEQPVLSSRVNAKVTAQNMQVFLSNIGHFHSTVQGDTVNKSYFTRAIYHATVEPQYLLDTVQWISDSSVLVSILRMNSGSRQGLLKTGKPYRLSDITAERDRLDLFLKRKGYYFFNPDYIMAYADTTIGKRKVNLLLNLKKITPPEAKRPYSINRIIIFPNYGLGSGDPDTTLVNMKYYDSLFIRDDEKRFTKRLFAQTITYRPGSVYDSKSQNTTLNRLISLGVFKFVKNRFEPVKDSGKSLLNVYYYLTPAKKKSLQGSIDAFSKDNSYVGSQASINWRNRNAARGAEQLGIKAYGGFETSFADSLKGNNNYRLGTEWSLRIPRYVVPFLRIKENNFYPPRTSFILGYEWFRKQLSYTKNMFRFQYEFTWRNSLQNEFTFAPVSLSYLNASNITDSFRKEIIRDPSLGITVFSEAILGSYFSYTYNSSFRSRRHKIFLNTSADVSGNIAGLITGAKTYREKEVFNTPFAQYIKFDVDFHYTRKGNNGLDWANRIQAGAGIPYNNSRILPFAKLYSIGGSNSIRGFRARNLGPGTNRPTAEQQRFFQIIGGDFKLLFNSELRIPISRLLGTALFIDAGNTWTKDTLLFGPAGKLTGNFYKEIAVAGGAGIRFDATVILIRLDVGIPFRKPFLPEKDRWVMDKIDLSSKAWRKDNLVFNIAIGYPF